MIKYTLTQYTKEYLAQYIKECLKYTKNTIIAYNIEVK